MDAVHSSAPAGTVHLLLPAQLSEYDRGTGSAHGWGVAETLALGYQLYPEDMPDQVTLIGIEGKNYQPGDPLSEAVKKSLKQVVELLEGEIGRLLNAE